MLASFLPAEEVPRELPGPQNYSFIEAYDHQTERASGLDRMALVGRTVVRAHRLGLAAHGHVATSFGPIDAGPAPDGVYAIANSNGLAAFHLGTRADLSVTMLDERGHAGWASARALTLRGIDGDLLGEIASQKACVLGERQTLESGEYEVVLEPAAVGGLVGVLGRTCGAADMAVGQSFLSDRIGDMVTGESITIIDDNAHELHCGAPFDVQGVSRRSVPLIEGGRAIGAVYGFESARRAGVDPTGHVVSDARGRPCERAQHLVMAGGDHSLEEMVSGVKRGVLITRLGTVRVLDARSSTVTAVSRDGTFLIQDGEIVGPLHDVRLQTSVLDLLASVDMLGEQILGEDAVVPAVRASGVMLRPSVGA